MTSSDRIERWLITVGLLGIIAFLAAGLIFSETKQEASESRTVTMNKQEAGQAAAAFVSDRFHMQSEPLLVTLQSHQLLQGYLQIIDGMPMYSESFQRLVPLDFYRIELTGTGQARFEVDVHPNSGEIVAWTASIPGLTDGEDPFNDESIMDVAVRTLSEQGFQQAGWQRDGHADSGPFSLVLVHPESHAGDARLQVRVRVDNGIVTEFRPTFHIPSADAHWMARQEQSAMTMSQLHLWFNLIMLAVAIILSIRYRRVLNFRQGIVLTAIFLVLYTIHQFNLYPAYQAVLPPGTERAFIVWANVVISLLLAVLLALLVWLSVVVGNKLMTSAGWSSVRHCASESGAVTLAMGRGYLLAFAILGLQQVMYAIAQRYFGVWTINDPMLSLHNLVWPLLYPLLAWAAAISEEAIYRLYAIPLLKKAVRSTFAAALLSSMIWAIGHTAYPIYPAFTRFVEVTLLGLLFAFILLKFGFLTSIFTHASVNSILMGLSLFADADTIGPTPTATFLWGLMCIASPALVAVIVYRFRRTPRHSDG